MYFVYILLSKLDNKRYIGITNNLSRRIKDHNNGKNVSTKYRRPLELIYYEKYNNRKEAREREKYLKSGIGREYLDNKINNRGR